MKFQAVIFAICLSGCASLSLELPEISQTEFKSEKSQQLDTAWDLYLSHNDRLQRVGADILQANAKLCGRTGPVRVGQGMKLKAFPKPLRDKAEEAGFDDRKRVLYSPNGQFKFASLLPEQSSPDETDKLQCDYNIKLLYSPAVNAYATGREIRVTTGMMEFANDDEIAIIVGHELGHNELSHIRKIITNRVLSLGAARYTRQFENEADYAGLYYAARAGYEIDNAPELWRRIAKRSLKSIDKPRSHPTTPERFLRLRQTVLEIRLKRESGEDLRPNERAVR